jgi:hypothetical protein
MSVACRLSPQQRKSVCQSATSEARTARIAPPGRPARDTVVGPRPADASWTYNAQTLGQLRADTPRIPGGRSLQRRSWRRPPTRPRAAAGPELKMPSSNFCLIPRSVAILVPVISNQRQAAASASVRPGSAPGARTPDGAARGAARASPDVRYPKKFGGVCLPPRWSCPRRGLTHPP